MIGGWVVELQTPPRLIKFGGKVASGMASVVDSLPKNSLGDGCAPNPGTCVQAICPVTQSNYWTSLFWLHLYWTALYDSVVIKAWLTTVEIHSFARCFRSTIKIWKIATILYHTELEYIRLLRRELFR